MSFCIGLRPLQDPNVHVYCSQWNSELRFHNSCFGTHMEKAMASGCKLTLDHWMGPNPTDQTNPISLGEDTRNKLNQTPNSKGCQPNQQRAFCIGANPSIRLYHKGFQTKSHVNRTKPHHKITFMKPFPVSGFQQNVDT